MQASYVRNVSGTDVPYLPGEQLVVEARESLVEMLRTVPWQIFTTHTITRPMRDEPRYAIWPDYLDAVREQYRDTLGLAWCLEQDPANRVEIHYHALWTATKPLNQDIVRDRWTERAGRSGRPIVIQRWDGSPRCIDYLRKWDLNPYCHWHLEHGIEFFMHGQAPLSGSKANRRHRRLMRRNPGWTLSSETSMGS
jgi:hypothetical protein